ncbi:hypothetical protein BD560DRAFT_440478 [Blakeslea trispora]|nr:hypothetical protein BD560DRAFT_440478 [Blakeslea trispora]
MVNQTRRNARYANRQQNEQTSRRRGRSVPLPAAYISEIDRLQPFNLGSMEKVCTDCGAKHWEAELPAQCTSQNRFWMSCCKAGAVKLETLQSPPDFFRTFFEEMSARCLHFKDNIRRYDAAFAFTSLGCEVSLHNLGNIPFQIHG